MTGRKGISHSFFRKKKEKEIEFRGGKKHLLVKFAGSNLYFSFEFDGEKELVTPRLSPYCSSAYSLRHISFPAFSFLLSEAPDFKISGN